MSTTPAPTISWSSQLYRALLVFFPPRFRAEYEREMVLFFRDSLRAAHRTGSALNVFFCWLTAIVDLGQSAVHEWFVQRPGPGHYALKLGIGLAAGAVGGVVAGLGARLAMRGVALAAGLETSFTLGGTLVIVIFGLMLGTPFGVGFMALRSLLPGAGAWKGLVYGLLLFVVFLAPPLLFYREGEALLASPLIGVSLFAPLPLAYGITVAGAALFVESRLHRTAAPRPAIRLPAVVTQTLAVVVFALLLQLGVLGALSISNHIQPIPPGIVLAAREAKLPFVVLRNANNWLVTLTTLGYFGLAGVLFWARQRSFMARLTAVVLLLFSAGLFNTGARYFDHLVTDLTPVQASLHGLQVLGVSALLALLYVFPHGRLATAWARPVAVAWLAFASLWLLVPLYESLTLSVVAGFFVSGLFAQIQRYRAAPADERRQQRWPVVGFAVAILGFSLVALAVLVAPGLKLSRVDGLGVIAAFGLYMLPWLFIPMTIAYAMRRHRLWAT
jgi:hypothetical protein